MKKYKIIKFQDANGEEFYEVWTATPTVLTEIFGLKWKSEKEKSGLNVRYNNLNQAQYAVRSMKIKETVIEEGVFDD